jgi:hypothetical protein
MKTKNPLLLLIALLISFQVKATHMAGSDLTYQYIGNNQYLVTYTFYRDCIGISAQTSIPLTITSNSCGLNQSATLLPVPGTGQEITYTCPNAITTCNGGSAPGIQRWEYTATVTINDSCPDWTFGAQACCRNAAITTIIDPTAQNMYIEAHLNNTQSSNNSPVFSNIPIAFECVNQDNYFNHGGLDIDGDSLVYSFATPNSQPNLPVTYITPYSTTNFLTSNPALNINPLTGDIFMHPTNLNEITVIAVEIQEWRNGVLIGSVVRDLQIYVIQCNNQLPTASGINGTPSYTMHTCLNGPVCFDIYTNDPDSGQIVTALHNNGIPAATFVIDTSGQFPLVHFCWPATQADVRPQPYFFTLTVHDNACPSNGVQSYAYTIFLSNLQANVTSSDISCHGGHNGSIHITATDSSAQFMTTPGLFTTPNIGHLYPGNYTINVSNGGGCTSVYYATIVEPPLLTTSVNSQNANCAGAALAVATGGGGTMPYTYSWNTTPVTLDDSLSNVAAGTYTVTTTDAHQCTSTASVVFNPATPFTLSMTSTPASCTSNNGTATAHTAGTSGPFSYVWTPNVSTGSHATNLPAGIYSVLVTDNTTGCTQSNSVTVGNSSGLNATVSSTTDATCSNGEDGAATVMAIGGQPPYTYLWSPGGQTTATVSNLSPGNYTVVVADYLGCPTYLQVPIGYMFNAPTVTLPPDSQMCNGDSLMLDAGQGYSYLWSDNSTGQTLTVHSPGIYSVLVTDANGCQASDAINITYVICFTNPTKTHWHSPFFQVIPNPVIGDIEINMHYFDKGRTTIRIMNLQGAIVLTDEVNIDGTTRKIINLSSLASGSYTLQIVNGGNLYSSKLIKIE